MQEPSSNEIYQVTEHARKGAWIRSMEQYRKLYEESIQEPERFWAEQAKRLDWFHPWHTVMDWDFHQAHARWFSGGRLNVSHNCVDRHLPQKKDQIAIIWESDSSKENRTITYKQLYFEVCRIANVLKAHGIGKGDKVCIYLPMIPELAYSMLACARIGAIHSVIFGGFSAESIRDRVLDCGAKMVITANEGFRGGKTLPLKSIVDHAIDGLEQVRTVLIAKRTSTEVSMKHSRDFWLDQEVEKQRGECSAEWMDAEDPLFILYTSGSTGKPKGALHTTGGYLVYASLTHQYVFDYHPGDIYFCTADIGWVTGHSYVIYGPLSNGATTVMFESIPTYPDAGRYWDIVERYKVNIFYTAPTAIRTIAREGDEFVRKYDRSSLRVLGTVGEPINPEAWKWYYHVVGEGGCAIVDTWWQTETGGIMITPLPGVTPLKPGSATLPFFGIQPCLLDGNTGKEIRGNGVSGVLCIKSPWPGMARTVYGDHKRFQDTYFRQYPGYYFTGDGCKRDTDGYYWITGRVDDVLNVAGHRLGTAEIESSINSNPMVAESAVVGYPHDIKGTGIFAFVVLKKEAEKTPPQEVMGAVKSQVTQDIGSFAKPDQVLVAPGLPKTRSGKIMRRILRKIASHEYSEMGNITTLADPSVVEKIIEEHRKAFSK